MAREHKNAIPAIWLLLALLLTSISAGLVEQPGQWKSEAELDGMEAAASGRQVEADCEGLTFENIFNYSFAYFDIDVYDTWDGALFQLVAYVNGTMAGDLRADVDELFDGLPGGNNSYLSTDERDGLEAVGMDCVVQTYTRTGFRGGPAHRGGQGVEWNNATWVREGMTIGEHNLLPSNDPNRRDCKNAAGQPSGSAGCWEIPVYPATDGDCGATSCDLIVWLNATVDFDKASDPNNFTFGMNMTNMSNIEVDLTLPLTSSDVGSLEGMRVALAEECDGRDASLADTGGSATIPGECTNDGSISVTSRMADADHLQVTVLSTYDHDIWPVGQDLFIDFTTSPPPVDDPPEWTADAPADGDLLPVADVAVKQDIVDEEKIREWFSDELDPGMLTLSCSGADGWSLTGGAANAWSVTPQVGATTTVTCGATDLAGQESGERTFSVAAPLGASVDSTDVTGQFGITLTPTSNAPGPMDVTVTLLHAGGSSTASGTVSGSASTLSVDSTVLGPGAMTVLVTASGAGMADFAHNYDLGLAKASIPPTVTISGEEWIEGSFILSGNFHDADGEDVTFTLRIDGVEQGQVAVSANNWQTGDIPMDLLVEGIHTVEVEACDASNVCTSVTKAVDNTFLFHEEDEPVTTLPVEDGDDGLPAPGLAWVLFALLSATMFLRRRN